MRSGRLVEEVGRYLSGEADMGGWVGVQSLCAGGRVRIVWRGV